MRFDENGVVIRAPGQEQDFSLTFDDTIIGIAGETYAYQSNDALLIRITTSPARTGFSFSIGSQSFTGPVTVENLAPEIASLSPSRVVTRLQDGLAMVRVSNAAFGSRVFTRRLSELSDGYDTHNGFVSGSLAEHMGQLSTSYYGTLGVNNERASIYAGTNYNTLYYNPLRLAQPINLSWMARENGGPAYLIGPRHVLLCQHYNNWVGGSKTYTFLRPDNTMQTVTLTGYAEFVHINNYMSDHAIAITDQPVTGCDFVRLMSSDQIDTYIPSIKNHERVAYAAGYVCPQVFNQEWTIPVYGRRLVPTYITMNGPRLVTKSSSVNYYGNPSWADYIGGIPGDSGSPMFFALKESADDTNPVCVLHGHLGGNSWLGFTDEIETLMNELAGTAPGTYQTLKPNLSRFLTY